MASAYFYSGKTDRAIQVTNAVLSRNRNHIQANFNLGIFYWQGRRDFAAAYKQFAQVIALTAKASDADSKTIHANAARNLPLIEKDAAAAGEPVQSIETTGGQL
jgi:tetratricopeptide (TPR) repeat protein